MLWKNVCFKVGKSGGLKMCNKDNILGKIDYEIIDTENDYSCSDDFKHGLLYGLRLAKRFIKEEI